MVTVTTALKTPVAGAFAVFTPSVVLKDSADSKHTLPLPARVDFETDGTLSVSLPATDDPTITPADWFYRVEIRAGDYRTAFSVLLPTSATPVDLFDLAPAETMTPRFTRVLSVNGVFPDAEGNVVVAGGGGGSVAWTDVTGKPTTFAPSAHTHAQADITGLSTSLAGKENTGVAAGLLSAHTAAADPHPQYLTAAEGSASFDAAGTAAAGMAAHTAASDPHPQYLTATEGNAAYEPAGASSSAVSGHTAAADPHPQYLTATEGNAAYEPTGSVAAHVAAADPHPQYLTPTEGNAAYDAAGTAAAAVGALAPVASSGAYADLTGKPTLAPVATSGAYADLTGKPTLATVATSGDYDDLTDKPTIPSVTTFAQFAVWSGSAWPSRPAGSQPVIWIGGSTSPTGAVANDVWIPAS